MHDVARALPPQNFTQISSGVRDLSTQNCKNWKFLATFSLPNDISWSMVKKFTDYRYVHAYKLQATFKFWISSLSGNR